MRPELSYVWRMSAAGCRGWEDGGRNRCGMKEEGKEEMGGGGRNRCSREGERRERGERGDSKEGEGEKLTGSFRNSSHASLNCFRCFFTDIEPMRE